VSAASATAVLMDRGVYRHAVHSVNCEGCFVVEVVGFVRTWESEGGWGWGGECYICSRTAYGVVVKGRWRYVVSGGGEEVRKE